MRGWRLTRRGDYINSELANRTRAAVVSLERSGLWAFVVRTLQGQETGRGRNYLSDGGRGHASGGSVHGASQTKQRDCGASDGLPKRQTGRDTMSADKRAIVGQSYCRCQNCQHRNDDEYALSCFVSCL